MGFEIKAFLGGVKKNSGANKDGKGADVAAIDIRAVGAWPGREVSDEDNQQDGALLAVTTEFQAMTRAHPDKSKPMFISWKPANKEKMLFSNKFRGSTLQIRIQIMRRTEQAYPEGWLLRFEGGKVIRIAHSNKLQQVQFSFKDFYLETQR
ncbi:MAG: hypothetical protein H7070_07310 [Saprospiraceae bacterium]|nr:hypothetical protein [Pyrinomonadaceae bacterium]